MIKRYLVAAALLVVVLGGFAVEHAIESRDAEILQLTLERNKLSDFLQVTEQALVASQDANEQLLKQYKAQELLLLEATQKRRVAIAATAQVKKDFEKVIEYEANNDWASAKLPDDVKRLLDGARSAEDNRYKTSARVTPTQFVRTGFATLAAD